MNAVLGFPASIRVSLGSAITLHLLSGKLDAMPTTTYLMTYRPQKCVANCGFCPQARTSTAKAGMLSRVSWPIFSTGRVLTALRTSVKEGKIERVCIQALNYPEVFNDLQALVKAIKEFDQLPISISCQPMNSVNLKRLADAGVERIGIPLDAANEELFNKIKGKNAGGPYDWKAQFQLLKEASKVFGEGKVSTHLIVGLGETEKEMTRTIQQCVDMTILPALFAFTPVQGTTLERKSQPSIASYRRMQLARYLIVNRNSRFENMAFDEREELVDFGVSSKILLTAVQNGEPFRTSGCPSCNRPYYNEKPSGPIYNYPRKLTSEELDNLRFQLKLVRSNET